MRTEVHLLSHGEYNEVTLLFGRVAEERELRPGHRVAVFEPGEVFGVVRRHRDSDGKDHFQVEVIRAARPGEPYWSGIACVTPGGELLVSAKGSLAVDTVKAAVESMEAMLVRPHMAAPEYWLHVGNRLAAGKRPRSYSIRRHAAWLMRKRVRW